MNYTVHTVNAILIGAGQRGAQVYGAFARRNPKDIRFVAVAEPDAARRAEFCRDHGISPENAAADWRELLARPKLADCAFVCTQDNQHIAPAMGCAGCRISCGDGKTDEPLCRRAARAAGPGRADR